MNNPTNDEINAPVMLRGWITPCQKKLIDVNEARRELESCGVLVGVWDMHEREFQECVVSTAAFEKLHELWGKYIWGLT